jgi:molybdopterin-containing oxidoreductase family iron-sulfur binding subunit
MQFNPEVTVRARGVMEKCTFCVQRIEKVRIEAGNERRPIADGEIMPACAQTCPTQAITFGNLNDPQSAVSTLREEKRSYVTLAELNIRPRTHYLGRLNNRDDDEGSTGHGASHQEAGDHGKETA